MIAKFDPKYMDLTRGYSVERMETECLARFKDLEFRENTYADAALPNHAREVASGLGRYDGEVGSRSLASAGPNYMVSWCRAGAGQRSFIHYHKWVETYMPIEGRLTIYWGEEEGEREIEIGPLDCLAVPSGVYRSFINRGDKECLFMVVLGGVGQDSVGVMDVEGFQKNLASVGVEMTSQELLDSA